MGRPPLPIGTYGAVRHYRASTGWRAMTKFRDFDGRTRSVERTGRTKTAADRALKEALRERVRAVGGGDVTPETRFRDVAELWFQLIVEAVANGTRSPGTLGTYRSILDRQILPGLGDFRVRELAVGPLDRFLVTVRRTTGLATAKTARSVISGVVGLAVRQGALASNPVRDTSPLEVGRKKGPRALSLAEREAWFAQLDADEVAVRKDLPDLCRFMLATGVRIGEALAVYWSDVDLDGCTVRIDHTVLRVKGDGLRRFPTKTAAGERTLPLPGWVVTMLRERRATDLADDGPVFPDSLGGLRDPSNTMADLRDARGTEGFAWVTSHVFRKTAATILDEAGLTARVIADQLGHSKPSMTQDVYLARKVVDPATAEALERAAVKEPPGV